MVFRRDVNRASIEPVTTYMAQRSVAVLLDRNGQTTKLRLKLSIRTFEYKGERDHGADLVHSPKHSPQAPAASTAK